MKILSNPLRALATAGLAAGLSIALFACGGGYGGGDYMPPAGSPPPAAMTAFGITNLVSDTAGGAAHSDPNLVNAWGLAFNPQGFVWVAANGSDKSTLYDGNGVPQSLVVATPPAPTGIVYNARRLPHQCQRPQRRQPLPVRRRKRRRLGLVDVFDAGGTLIRQLVVGGALNAPWGLAMAPANFGSFSNMLLVANFGEGKINAYDPITGAAKGALGKANGSAIVIVGLWGIAFGNGLNSQPSNTLPFTAGPGDATHGQHGRIDMN
jgi:hypothetical protein